MIAWNEDEPQSQLFEYAQEVSIRYREPENEALHMLRQESYPWWYVTNLWKPKPVEA